MLLARPLFSGQNEFEILTNIYEANLSVLDRHGLELNAGVLETLRKALSREPERRFQSAVDFATAVREVVRELDLQLGDAELVPWLSNLGILPSGSAWPSNRRRRRVHRASVSRSHAALPGAARSIA